GAVIHWYQQKANEAPERILYFSQTKTVDEGFQAHRYMVERLSNQKVCILTINNVIPDDTATYYCAYWHIHALVYSGYYKVFGTGTKLIVSDKGNSPPANSEILQKEHGDQITYVCLIEKFYPEVIRVTWTDGENKEVTNDVAKGDPWKSTEGDEYSIGSWLTVPAENKDKNYYCKYEHESKEGSLQTQGTYYILFCLMFVTDHLLHRTAYLVYIVLLLKSSMYYLIVLFFIYR
ncbi:IGK protein, partial [Chunga burmeisteri]|nr:IGK protein [Chunga burmeisteri]